MPPPSKEIARAGWAKGRAILALKRAEKAAETEPIEQRLTKTAEKRLRAYLRRFASAMPVSERVKRYTAVIRGELPAPEAQATLKALERIESLEGIVTRKELRDAEATGPNIAPLFVWAQGAQINVNPGYKSAGSNNKPPDEPGADVSRDTVTVKAVESET